MQLRVTAGWSQTNLLLPIINCHLLLDYCHEFFFFVVVVFNNTAYNVYIKLCEGRKGKSPRE